MLRVASPCKKCKDMSHQSKETLRNTPEQVHPKNSIPSSLAPAHSRNRTLNLIHHKRGHRCSSQSRSHLPRKLGRGPHTKKRQEVHEELLKRRYGIRRVVFEVGPELLGVRGAEALQVPEKGRAASPQQCPVGTACLLQSRQWSTLHPKPMNRALAATQELSNQGYAGTAAH